MSVIIKDLELVLCYLLEKESRTGYDLRKEMSEVFDNWPHQQIYRTLAKHNGMLWDFEYIPQDGKPDKKVYTIRNYWRNLIDTNFVFRTSTLLYVNNAELLLEARERLTKQLSRAQTLLSSGGLTGASRRKLERDIEECSMELSRITKLLVRLVEGVQCNEAC